jgi:hypothetical protein
LYFRAAGAVGVISAGLMEVLRIDGCFVACLCFFKTRPVQAGFSFYVKFLPPRPHTGSAAACT